MEWPYLEHWYEFYNMFLIKFISQPFMHSNSMWSIQIFKDKAKVVVIWLEYRSLVANVHEPNIGSCAYFSGQYSGL